MGKRDLALADPFPPLIPSFPHPSPSQNHFPTHTLRASTSPRSPSFLHPAPTTYTRENFTNEARQATEWRLD